MSVRKILSGAIVAGAFCLTISTNLVAAVPNTAPMITYTAAGTFGSTPVSGADTLKLAGEPFTVSIAVSASTVPFKTGPNYAAYHQLRLVGEVNSGLLGSSPVNIASGESSITQALDPSVSDLFTMQAPIKVVGINLTIKASITMPFGTISKPLLHPFATVSLTPSTATLNYSDGTNATLLSIQTGTLSATIPTGGAPTASNEMQPRSAGELAGTFLELPIGSEAADLRSDVDIKIRRENILAA